MLLGNAGLRSHFPAQFEPMEDRGERPIEEEEEEDRGEEDDRMAEGPEEQAGISVEAQIGRKLREIGDKFQQDHVELVSFDPVQRSGSSNELPLQTSSYRACVQKVWEKEHKQHKHKRI